MAFPHDVPNKYNSLASIYTVAALLKNSTLLGLSRNYKNKNWCEYAKLCKCGMIPIENSDAESPAALADSGVKHQYNGSGRH